jgi:hypothetical protein
MIRRPPTRRPGADRLFAFAAFAAFVTVVDAVVGTAVGTGIVTGGVVTAVSTAAAVAVVVTGLVAIAGAVVIGGVTLIHRLQGQGRSVRVRRTRSSGSPGGLGWRHVSLGGNMRSLLHACTSVDRLVDCLLDRAVEKLPAVASARFAEEWQDHRQHRSGWRLVWWALCVRATARHTVAGLGPAGLPRDS